LNSVAEDPSGRETRLRRKNRTTLIVVSIGLLALMSLGYAFGHWLMKHPPTSAH